MSHYKPGTLDDVAYNARKRAKQRRLLNRIQSLRVIAPRITSNS